ncbi:MAG: transcriptional repressor [Desulfotalea sp.]
MRMTKQRIAILQELQKSCQHLTADVLYDRVRKVLPKVSLATIYRNLELMAEGRMIKQLDVGGSKKVFDADVTPHHHIFCLSCHRVDNIDFTGEDHFLEVEKSDYKISGYRIDIVGICKNCSKNNE